MASQILARDPGDMVQHRPIPVHNAPTHVPAGGAVDVGGLAAPSRKAVDMVRAQQALGAPLAEAVGMTASILGEAAVFPMLDEAMDHLPDSMAKLHLLDDIAKISPVLANAQLNALLATGRMPAWQSLSQPGLHLGSRAWVASLPQGLEVKGHLYLDDCQFLKQLPDGLQVDGALNLHGCTALECLPAGLVVRSSMSLFGCDAWDGRIPDDAQIGDLFYTPRYPGYPGIFLADWRERHPNGEFCNR